MIHEKILSYIARKDDLYDIDHIFIKKYSLYCEIFEIKDESKEDIIRDNKAIRNFIKKELNVVDIKIDPISNHSYPLPRKFINKSDARVLVQHFCAPDSQVYIKFPELTILEVISYKSNGINIKINSRDKYLSLTNLQLELKKANNNSANKDSDLYKSNCNFSTWKKLKGSIIKIKFVHQQAFGETLDSVDDMINNLSTEKRKEKYIHPWIAMEYASWANIEFWGCIAEIFTKYITGDISLVSSFMNNYDAIYNTQSNIFINSYSNQLIDSNPEIRKLFEEERDKMKKMKSIIRKQTYDIESYQKEISSLNHNLEYYDIKDNINLRNIDPEELDKYHDYNDIINFMEMNDAQKCLEKSNIKIYNKDGSINKNIITKLHAQLNVNERLQRKLDKLNDDMKKIDKDAVIELKRQVDHLNIKIKSQNKVLSSIKNGVKISSAKMKSIKKNIYETYYVDDLDIETIRISPIKGVDRFANYKNLQEGKMYDNRLFIYYNYQKNTICLSKCKIINKSLKFHGFNVIDTDEYKRAECEHICRRLKCENCLDDIDIPICNGLCKAGVDDLILFIRKIFHDFAIYNGGNYLIIKKNKDIDLIEFRLYQIFELCNIKIISRNKKECTYIGTGISDYLL